ncbi:MAG: hypothetical protein GY799_01555 [Desulfobulbaceae bacterium]|nr:hypothetical protein [Desulfobulbaceae bacterium]
MKITACLLLLILLNGCSGGRYYKLQGPNEGFFPHINPKDATLIHDIATSCETPKLNLEKCNDNTVFVHPGLLLLNLNWDQSLAVDSAKILITHGYAKDFLQLRDRDASKTGERMLKDPGERFIGLHYSMGGQPQLLSATLTSIAQARQESGKDLVYYPVLVDPFEIEQVNTLIDFDAPQLGQVFIVLSGNYSFLRPYIMGIRKDILNHPKVHLIYAEDVGENWGHFSALGSVVSDDTPSRFRDIFFLIAETVVHGYSSTEFEGRLALLKIKYAMEDSRPISSVWLRLARELQCAPQSTRSIVAKAQIQ